MLLWMARTIFLYLIIGIVYCLFCLTGRRGVFAGVIEEIHQHWKHKEVVKVVTKQSRASQIMYTAKLLEVETGGILIAVEKCATSHVIILYRGKNYHRPKKSSPANLLTKREALHRSIEAQRRGVGISIINDVILVNFSTR
jgi:RNA-binding protein YhbY